MTDPKDAVVVGTAVTDQTAPGTDVVPAAFVVQRPKPVPRDGLDPKSMEALRNRPVEIHAGAVIYRGVLVGADTEEVFLRTDLRYTSVPLERVARIIPTDVKPAPLPKGSVDPSFFHPMPGEDEG
ncbi:MAG: hypothetical protein HY904_11750 [Deltaproteobacteria bacterium]|nr:hypothetical protein [Deltaproteobacteria bacterium]